MAEQARKRQRVLAEDDEDESEAVSVSVSRAAVGLGQRAGIGASGLMSSVPAYAAAAAATVPMLAPMMRPAIGGGIHTGTGIGIGNNSSSNQIHVPASSSAHAPRSMSAKVERLMRASGYSGKGGLGARGQGIVEPVLPSAQISTQGLGFKSKIRRQSHVYVAEKVQVKVVPKWITLPPAADVIRGATGVDGASRQASKSATFLAPPDSFADWITCQPASAAIASDVINGAFADVGIQTKLHGSKSLFDGVDSRTFRSARERANPFELLKKAVFQNRAALKMAEIDALCGRIFTSPPSFRVQPVGSSHVASGQRQQQHRRSRRELLYFADICAGPGGFTEFMLTVLKWRAKGFGFTLRNNLDFRVEKFNSNAPHHSFAAYYGETGTGDITITANMQSFAREVWVGTRGRGLHVVLADGGFGVDGKYERQELLSQQLVLCQFATALATLRRGGSFVCKVFDTFLPFTVHCLYLLRRHFRKFCLLKPNQSRPANSERYVVCHDLLVVKAPVVEYMYKVNDMMNKSKQGRNSADDSRTVVVGIVPDEIIFEDEEFVNYVHDFNMQRAHNQLHHLERIKKYVEDLNLSSDSQTRIRQDSLDFWQVPSDWEPSSQFLPTAHGVSEAQGDKQQRGRLATQHRRRYVSVDQDYGKKLFRAGRGRWEYADESAVRLVSAIGAEMRQYISHEMGKYAAAGTQAIEPFFGRKSCDWFVYVLPAGGTRYAVLCTPIGLQLYDYDGYLDVRTAERRVTNLGFRIASDTVLDVVVHSGVMYVLDAWALPGEPDFYCRRSRFSDRLELLDMFVDAMRAPQLRYVKPVCLYELVRAAAKHPSSRPEAVAAISRLRASGSASSASSAAPLQAYDVWAIRGNGPKPSASRVWRWDGHASSVQEFLECVSKWPIK